MPRIFHVTFTKEFEATIVAENEDELRHALENDEGDFDEWADSSYWTYNIYDPLRGNNPDRIPKKHTEPDMGVVKDSCLHISDYEVKHPGYLEGVQAEADEVARKLTLERVNLKLPFPD